MEVAELDLSTGVIEFNLARTWRSCDPEPSDLAPVKGLSSVITSLIKRAQSAINADTLEEDDEDAVEDWDREDPSVENDGEENAPNSSQEMDTAREDSADEESSKLKNATPSKKEKRKDKLKKANKEEQEWLEEGVNFLDETEYAEGEGQLLKMMAAELSHSDFYVYRGPLLSEEKREYYRTLEDRNKAKESRNSKKRSKEKQKKSRHKQGSKKKTKKKKAKTLDDFKASLDQVLLKINEAIKKSTERNPAEENPFDSCIKQVDSALRTMLPYFEEKKLPDEQRELLKSKLGELHNTWKDDEGIDMHLKRCRLAKKLRTLQDEQRSLLNELKEYIEKIKPQLPQNTEITPATWLSKIKDGEDFSLDTLKRLYFNLFFSSSLQDEEHSSWLDVLEKLTAKIATLPTPSSHDDFLYPAICLGYVQRLAGGLEKVFSWETDGIEKMKQYGDILRKIESFTNEKRRLETKLFNKTRSAMYSINSQITHLVGLWNANEMQADEISALLGLGPKKVKKAKKNAVDSSQTVDQNQQQHQKPKKKRKIEDKAQEAVDGGAAKPSSSSSSSSAGLELGDVGNGAVQTGEVNSGKNKVKKNQRGTNTSTKEGTIAIEEGPKRKKQRKQKESEQETSNDRASSKVGPKNAGSSRAVKKSATSDSNQAVEQSNTPRKVEQVPDPTQRPFKSIHFDRVTFRKVDFENSH